MNRRELIKAMAPLAMTTLVVKGEDVGRVVEVKPGGKYLVFVNARSGLDLENFCQNAGALPGGTPIHVLDVPQGESIDEMICIYKVDP